MPRASYPSRSRQLEAGPEVAEIVVSGAPNTENRDAEMVPDWLTWLTDIEASDRRGARGRRRLPLRRRGRWRRPVRDRRL